MPASVIISKTTNLPRSSVAGPRQKPPKLHLEPDGSRKEAAHHRPPSQRCQIANPGRFVHPRARDLTESISDFQTPSPCHDIELATLDVEDSSHTLTLRKQNRRSMVFKTSTLFFFQKRRKISIVWACFLRWCCGMAAAPLIWCSVAVAGCRLSRTYSGRPTCCCFVDNPIIPIRGTERTNIKLLGILFLFWTLLGFRFQWRKGDRGRRIVWSGWHQVHHLGGSSHGRPPSLAWSSARDHGTQNVGRSSH